MEVIQIEVLVLGLVIVFVILLQWKDYGKIRSLERRVDKLQRQIDGIAARDYDDNR